MKKKIRVILICVFCLGGHDNDTINSGSGRLNPDDGSYLHEFRINEAVASLELYR